MLMGQPPPSGTRLFVKRVAVIGNTGGGKSRLARKIAADRGLPYSEIDVILWRPGWRATPVDVYEAEHSRLIGQPNWVIDGLGRKDSIPVRLARATEIGLIDMPLWVHFWLAAERQLAWAVGRLDDPPAGLTEMPSTEGLFRTIWEVDRDWMPEIRRLADQEERSGKIVHRLSTIEMVSKFG
jgi:adenylate kinase family enzyme